MDHSDTHRRADDGADDRDRDGADDNPPRQVAHRSSGSAMITTRPAR